MTDFDSNIKEREGGRRGWGWGEGAGMREGLMEEDWTHRGGKGGGEFQLMARKHQKS